MTPTTSKPTLRWQDIVRHYGSFVRQHTGAHAALLFGYALGAIASTYGARIIYKDIVDVAAAGGATAHGELMMLLVYLTVVIVLYNIGYRVGDYYIIVTQSRILRDLHNHAHTALQEKSYEFFTNTFAGSLIAKTRRYVQAFETLHDTLVFQVWMSGIQLIAAVAVLSIESSILGMVFLAWFVLYGALTYLLVRWQVPKSLAAAAADTKTTAHYSDIISNILTVKMFGAAQNEIAAFRRTTDFQERARRAAWLQQSFWNGMLQAGAVAVFELAIMWTVVELWADGRVSAGTIVLVQAYVLVAFNIVWNISKNIVRASAALSDANEMLELLDAPVGVRDPEAPEPVIITSGAISFDHVTHRYQENGSIVLNTFSLTIPAGQRVALVGHSGAGKTTLVKLLLRFADTEQGAIFIDGQNIRNVAQDDLRKHIAYVPQEPLLFHRTLRENIAYGKHGATEEEVVAAAKRAHAHEFIEKLPHSYDTLVGERGIKLSGGERQRVAIARAMLKDAPIVVLDEATSSLDSVSEGLIQAGFDELMKGRTTIVIAHRLSTIQHMDRIVVLDKGTVAEDGTHAQLLAKGGIYAELWNSQVGGFIKE